MYSNNGRIFFFATLFFGVTACAFMDPADIFIRPLYFFLGGIGSMAVFGGTLFAFSKLRRRGFFFIVLSSVNIAGFFLGPWAWAIFFGVLNPVVGILLGLIGILINYSFMLAISHSPVR